MSSISQSEDPESLYGLLYACQRGQRVAIVGSHTDKNELRNGLYVEQNEDKYVTDFFQDEYTDDGRLLILTGSAGDGKSALLARGYNEAGGQIPAERVNMDATEARRKDNDYSDRLSAFFTGIIDEVVEGYGDRSAIAINYGLAVDFFERKDQLKELDPIWTAIQNSQTEPVYHSDNPNITVINLSHRRTYNTDPDSLGKGLVRDLIDRFDPTHDASPFSDAYNHEKSECPAGDQCLLQYNVRQLTNSDIKDQLARLFAGWSIVTGSYLNPRSIIDNIASLLLPIGLHDLPDHETCPVGAAIENGTLEGTADELIWNSIFHTLQTEELTEASRIDPASQTTFKTDQRALRWGTNIGEIKQEIPSLPKISFKNHVDQVRTLLRKEYVTKHNGETIIDQPTFTEFAATLTFFNSERDRKQLQEQAQELIKTVQAALGGWTGRQRNDGLVEFVDANRSATHRYLSDWEEPGFDPEKSEEETKSLAVPGRIKLMAKPPTGMESNIPIPISFDTYRLMTQISEGYTPNATDLNQSHAIRMLHSRLEDFTNKRERVIIENRSGDNAIAIEDADLGITVTSGDEQ
jgi:DNA phosphorothioation-dependent restriction protein DptF